MFRVDTANSSIANTSLTGDLCFRKARVKQSQNVKCLSRRQLVHDEWEAGMELQLVQTSQICLVT